MDTMPRVGPENMAVDEWLLETVTVPTLRIYRWAGDWGTVGYFGKISEAREAYPGVQWARRWTGGGTVDHRRGLTYTIALPAGEPLARARGAKSYRQIHSMVGEALRACGVFAKLSAGEDETGSVLCFSNPVCHDLIGEKGEKLAGAGQRRTAKGLLHQGSIEISHKVSVEKFSHTLASFLAVNWCQREIALDRAILDQKVQGRYGLAAWLEKR